MSTTIHPILNYFYSKFRTDYQQASGYLITENMDGLTVREAFSLNGSYFVCNSRIKLSPEKLCLTGPVNDQNQNIPGSSLLAGRVVDFTAPEMRFEGTKEERVTIVGLEGVSLIANKIASMKHLDIYLLVDAKFSLDCAQFSAFEDVRVFRMKLEQDQLQVGVQFDWQTYSDFMQSASQSKNTPV